MSSDRTYPTFTPCPECRIVGAHRFDCSLNPRTRAATPEQLQAASRPPGVPPDASPRGEFAAVLDAVRVVDGPNGDAYAVIEHRHIKATEALCRWVAATLPPLATGGA